MPEEPSIVEHDGLLDALHAAMSEMPQLHKDAVNPHFKNRFISYNALRDAVTPVLLRHGLMWQTFPTSQDGQPALRYRLVHRTGELVEDTMLLLGKSDSQGQGSAISYAKRYALQAVLNVVADEDDDGEAATAKPQNGGELATPDDVKSMVAAAKDLTPDQVKLALAACGIPDVKTYGQVPRAKTAELAKRLAGIER